MGEVLARCIQKAARMAPADFRRRRAPAPLCRKKSFASRRRRDERQHGLGAIDRKHFKMMTGRESGAA